MSVNNGPKMEIVLRIAHKQTSLKVNQACNTNPKNKN